MTGMLLTNSLGKTICELDIYLQKRTAADERAAAAAAALHIWEVKSLEPKTSMGSRNAVGIPSRDQAKNISKTCSSPHTNGG